MVLLFSMFPFPISPLPFYGVLVLTLRAFLSELVRSDAFNASRVIQVWLCVSVDRHSSLMVQMSSYFALKAR